MVEVPIKFKNIVSVFFVVSFSNSEKPMGFGGKCLWVMGRNFPQINSVDKVLG